MQLTNEQEAIIQTNQNLAINAVAGSGKTSTLVEYARARPGNSRILYIAFNKTVKLEAQERMLSAGLRNVRVETAHSLAFDQVMRGAGYKLVPGYKSHEWRSLLNINTGDRNIDLVLGSHVNKFISYFCNSGLTKIQDLNYTEVINEPLVKSLVGRFYEQLEQYTRTALAMMDKAEIGVTHDFYLKKFQLSKPKLPFDYILFDEAQDASAAMLEIFLNQDAVKVIVGDKHQQIYSWRYAVNSLDKVDFPVYSLSNSFRFNDEIALIANKILEWKQYLSLPPAIKINGVGKAGSESQTRATLGRSNLSLLLNAVSLEQSGLIKKVYFEGNINSYTFADEGASLYDVLHLQNGRHDAIQDKLIAEMENMAELESYVAYTDDNSLQMIVEIVKEFGNQLPGLIRKLKENHTATRQEAEHIFSTVHRCKGMEYDEVTLLNDFISEEKLRKNAAAVKTTLQQNRLTEEINILYVAATRAKNKLSLPPQISPLRSLHIQSETPPTFSRSRYRSPDPGLPEEIRTNPGKLINKGKKWTKEEENWLEERYAERMNPNEIAAGLGRTVLAIRYKLEEMGISID